MLICAGKFQLCCIVFGVRLDCLQNYCVANLYRPFFYSLILIATTTTMSCLWTDLIDVDVLWGRCRAMYMWFLKESLPSHVKPIIIINITTTIFHITIYYIIRASYYYYFKFYYLHKQLASASKQDISIFYYHYYHTGHMIWGSKRNSWETASK